MRHRILAALAFAFLLFALPAHAQSRVTSGPSYVSIGNPLQTAASANGNGTALTVTGYDTTIWTIAITGTATVNFEASPDSGTTWAPLTATLMGTTTTGTSTSSSGVWVTSSAALTTIRGRISGYSSGSVTATANLAPIGAFGNRVLMATLVTALEGEDFVNYLLAVTTKITVNSGYELTTYQSAVSGSQVVAGVIKASPGDLVSVTAYNGNASTLWLWLTNATTSPANALASSDASVKAIYGVPSKTSQTWTWTTGLYDSAGISYGLSTSATSYTADGTAADLMLNANFK